MLSSDDSSRRLKYLFRVGQGGMADVFLALARGPSDVAKLVVVKQLLGELSGKPIYRQMFLDEARLAARMNHPNVVQTYDVSEEDGEVQLTMEYLDGQSLNRILRELARRSRSPRPELLVRIVSEALGGLHYAHELRDFDGSHLGIVHRDVSPHNLIVTYEGQVKVVDFGIAKAEGSSVKTEAGVLKGKAAYMAPEQLSGEPVDRRADVFTAGTILWELLTMRRLMAAGTQVKTILRVLQEPVPRLAAYVPDVDPRLERIVARALERDPVRRFSTAQVMRDALEDWLATRPPVRREDIGQLVSGLFGELRAHTEAQIRDRIAHVEAASGSKVRLPGMEAGDEALIEAGASSPPRASDAPTSIATPSAMRRALLPTVRARSKPTLLRIVLGAGVAGALAYAGHVASHPLEAMSLPRGTVAVGMPPTEVGLASTPPAAITAPPIAAPATARIETPLVVTPRVRHPAR